MKTEAPFDITRTVCLQWSDVRVETTAGRKLLHGISGIAHPGEVVALMGASGAGKTTLLNTLLQRNLKGLQVEGEILLNGQEIGRSVTSISGYIQQEDLFIGTLTVREHLESQAKLRLPSTFSNAERMRRVDEVLIEMSLQGSQGSRIGIPGVVKGISGGEMKRLAFATELLSNPPLLFCDEPTTGLDSHMAMNVVKTLEHLAGVEGKTIICTIHQPSSEVFELFDKVVFLAQGRVAYHGSPYDAVMFFSKCGRMIPDHTNPADFYIDTLAIWPGKVEQCRQQCNQICDQFALSDERNRIDVAMEKTKKPRTLHPRQGASFIQLLLGLFMRYVKDNLRNPAVLRAKLLQKVFMALFTGALYWQTKHDDEKGIDGIRGALFYYISELTYSTVYGILTYMPNDFNLLAREYHDGIYPVLAYYIAKILSYIPIFTIDGFIMISVSYWMIGLSSVGFAKTIITCIFVEWNVVALGVAISSISPSYAFAVSVTGPLLTVLSMTGGLFTNTQSIPGWISWVQFLSWFRYGYESLIVNEFSDEKRYTTVCANSLSLIASRPVDPYFNNNWTSPNDTLEELHRTCSNNGTRVIQEFGFSVSHQYYNWLIMLLYTLLIYSIGYLGLVLRVYKSR